MWKKKAAKPAKSEPVNPEPAKPKPKTQAFEAALEFKWLNIDHDFSTMVDIGANDGSFGKFLQGYMGIDTVHAFEPLPAHQAILNEHGYTVHQMALGNENGSIDFFVNAQDASSSILPMSALFKTKFPELAEDQRIEVPIRRLDEVLEAKDLAHDVLIKMDAQGFEDKIIEGGQEVFSVAKAILVEMTFVPLYEGQALFNGIHAQLADLGFQLTGFKDQTCTVHERRPLFSHCIYQK